MAKNFNKSLHFTSLNDAWKFSFKFESADGSACLQQYGFWSILVATEPIFHFSVYIFENVDICYKIFLG